MAAAEEAVIGGKRGGMGRLQHQVAPALVDTVDEGRLSLRVAAPEHEDHWLLAVVDPLDDRVGESFPALALVRRGAAHLDRQQIGRASGRESVCHYVSIS